MDVFRSNTIAALCYARKSTFSFHDLVTDLSKALWNANDGGVRLDMPDSHFALCDLAGMRIGIAHAEMWREFPGSLTGRFYPECVLLSVGPGVIPSDVLPPQARFERVRQALVARLQDIAAADRILLFERHGVFDLDACDEVVDGVRVHLDEALAPRGDPVADARRPVPTGRDPKTNDTLKAVTAVNAASPEDMLHGLVRRVEAELDRMEATRRALEESDLFFAPRQRQQGLRLVVPRLWPGRGPATARLLMTSAPRRKGQDDYPDYDRMPDNVDERPLLHRVAVNALNASVMTFALPVGAALMTMAVFGREDMLVSSRATAITGTAMGLYHSGIAGHILSLIS